MTIRLERTVRGGWTKYSGPTPGTHMASKATGGRLSLMNLAACTILLGLCVSPVFAAVPKISCGDLRQLILIKDQKIVIVDVRPPVDFKAGHIQNAMNIPKELIAKAQLPIGGKIIVYCSEDSCPLSMSAASTLVSLGYQNVFQLDGGFGEWLKRHYPAQTGYAVKAQVGILQMSAADARLRMEGGSLQVLDVRPIAEFKSGHLPGALNVPLEALQLTTGYLDKNKTILVYDRLSGRSRQAAKELADTGFDAAELNGGISAWIRRNLPLEVK